MAQGLLHSMLLMQLASWSDRQPDIDVGALAGSCCHPRFILAYMVSTEGQDGIEQLAATNYNCSSI